MHVRNWNRSCLSFALAVPIALLALGVLADQASGAAGKPHDPGASKTTTEQTYDVSLAQLAYWRGLLERSDLPSLAREIKRGLKFDWPACASRERSPKLPAEVALRNDMCRGNAMLLVERLYDFASQMKVPDRNSLWPQLNALLDLRDSLDRQPSYVSAVLALSIEEYAIVMLMERVFRDWATNGARPILERIRSIGDMNKKLEIIIRNERGNEFFEAISKEVQDHVDIIFPASTRKLVVDYWTYWAFAYLAEQDIGAKIPESKGSLVSKVQKIPDREAGSGWVLPLLAYRDISVFAYSAYLTAGQTNQPALVFLTYIDATQKPSKEPTMADVKAAIREMPSMSSVPFLAHYVDMSRTQAIRYYRRISGKNNLSLLLY